MHLARKRRAGPTVSDCLGDFGIGRGEHYRACLGWQGFDIEAWGCGGEVDRLLEYCVTMEQSCEVRLSEWVVRSYDRVDLVAGFAELLSVL